MKFTSLAVLISAGLLAVASSESKQEASNEQLKSNQEASNDELTFYGEDVEVDFRFLKAKGTKAADIEIDEVTHFEVNEGADPKVNEVADPKVNEVADDEVATRNGLIGLRWLLFQNGTTGRWKNRHGGDLSRLSR
eukprot:CAMPEP_0117035106 /NCGR_PEP_ID=MMETSP0472-20121206/24951_1 /TAXON_ID=693140 ORGANISM="Tiarina fusus, Strain LIS" /NCGR_SAMPLE_ID=MMETSP0472 /ASSEMBLY_ACC=CAM_ASM_000603 /LENGTH=135 /DNA_ID=CAMNT_0004744473 /DNA_START=67 /DNA_END=473 /DNA_ORIENTATION=-